MARCPLPKGEGLGLPRADAVQVRIAAEKNRTAGHRDRGESRPVNRVSSDAAEGFSGSNDGRHSLFIEKVDLSAGEQRRRREIPAEPFLPMNFPGSGVQACGDSNIADDVQFVTDHKR